MVALHKAHCPHRSGAARRPFDGTTPLTEQMPAPLVSIVISAYNRPEMQRSALASQTYDALEFVIQENSTDLLPRIRTKPSPTMRSASRRMCYYKYRKVVFRSQAFT